VEPLEVTLIEAYQRAGLIVAFVAHDGDRFGDKCHLQTLKSYAEYDRCESLEAGADYLKSLPKNAFVLLSASRSVALLQERPAADT
jgi:hypothetical protein